SDVFKIVWALIDFFFCCSLTVRMAGIAHLVRFGSKLPRPVSEAFSIVPKAHGRH
ncbi:hypothetical protein V5799_011425, partial [Amblyomma americanum]